MKQFIKNKLREELSENNHINYVGLPNDMQVLISQFFGDQLDKEPPSILPLTTVKVDELPIIPTDRYDRGKEHIENMIGRDLPPIIISKGKLLDGRHRIHAAKIEGKQYLTAIDLTKYNITEERNVIKKLKKKLIVDESFDKPLSGMTEIDDFTYQVYDETVKAEITFKLEFNNDFLYRFKIIKAHQIDTYYSISWNFVDGTEKNDNNWRKVTASLFKIIDIFIRKLNPKLLEFTDHNETGKVYFHPIFAKTLNSLFPNYFTINYEDDGVVFMINKEYSTIRENSILKSVNNSGSRMPLEEAIRRYKYPHRNKGLFKGISRNDLRKEQLERIKNKLRYLF